MQIQANCPLSVYRYIPIHRLWQILSNNSLYFIRNTKWDDPFEGFLLKRYCEDTGANYQTLIADKFFLCCTKPFQREHFWRNYTPNKNGVVVKLKTKEVVNLDQAIICQLVKYPTKKEIRELLKSLANINKEQIADMLFVKRLGFKTENEIRFLIQKKQVEEVVAVSMENPNKVIEVIIFDPRMDWDTYEAHKRFIEREFGAYKIARSDLYDPERIFPANSKTKQMVIRRKSNPKMFKTP